MFTPYEFTIAQHWICAIEYGPGETDLSDDEAQELEFFLANVQADLGPGHWDYTDSPEFARDEITGLMADCITATYQARTA